MPDPLDGSRRRLLLRLALTAAAAGRPVAPLAALVPGARALALGRIPSPLPAGRSVFRFLGRVTVAGRPVTEATTIAPGEPIETGPDGELVFVEGADAFLVRGGSRLELRAPGASPSGSGARGWSLREGRVLSVFASGELRLETPLATVAVRGTGVYVEALPDRAYVCTCYGRTELRSRASGANETIESQHHDAPRTITTTGIERAPFRDHTDAELALLEALVGRVPPFAGPGAYGTRRRPY
jgi:hypothetical protein